MRALCFRLDDLFYSDVCLSPQTEPNANPRNLIFINHHVNTRILLVNNSESEFPGPLGRNLEVVSGLVHYLGRSESYMNIYLTLLLRRADAKSSLFLLSKTPLDTMTNQAARLVVLLCQKDLLGAVNLARDHGKLWPLVLAFLSAVRAENRIVDYANDMFAKTWLKSESSAREITTAELPFMACILRFIKVSALDGGDTDDLSAEEDIKNWEIYASLFGVYLSMKFANKFLVNLGRLLVAKKNVQAGHICFLLADELPGSVDDPTALFCILGADHNDSAKLTALVEVENIARTEILEFALRLNRPDFDCLPGLQPFKLVMAQKMAEAGDETKAIKYVTFINAFVRALPASRFSCNFKAQLREFENFLEVRTGKTSVGPKTRSFGSWF